MVDQKKKTEFAEPLFCTFLEKRLQNKLSRGLSTDPHPPLLFHVVTECPLSGLLLNNFVLIFALLTSLHPQLRAAVVLAVKLTCQSFHFRIFEEKIAQLEA